MNQATKHLAKLIIVATLTLCASAFAQAHKVNIFAALDGNMIVGKVYFSGGGVAEDVDVEVLAQDGLKIATVKTNSKGEFLFAPKMKDTQYLFSVDTGDGHAAKTTVAVGSALTPSQSGASKPRPPSFSQLQGKPGAAQPDVKASSSPAQAASPQVAIDPEIVAEVVSVELSKQLRPLAERIEQYESSVRMSNVFGGIGFIVGIAGVAAFFLSRRQEEQGKGPKAK